MSQTDSWVFVNEPRVHVRKLTSGQDRTDKHSGGPDKADGHDGDVDFTEGDLENPEI